MNWITTCNNTLIYSAKSIAQRPSGCGAPNRWSLANVKEKPKRLITVSESIKINAEYNVYGSN